MKDYKKQLSETHKVTKSKISNWFSNIGTSLTDEMFPAIENLSRYQTAINRTVEIIKSEYPFVRYYGNRVFKLYFGTSINRIFILKNNKTFLSLSENIVYDANGKKGKCNILIDILAFLHARPIFVLTKNDIYNDIVKSIYYDADILNYYRFRNLKKGKERGSVYEHYYKSYKQSLITIVDEPACPEVISIYHDALKQIEPFPKCVFLNRVIEYALTHDNPPIRNRNSVKEAINYYWEEAKKTKMLPVYLEYLCKNGNQIKRKYINAIIKLKKTAKHNEKKMIKDKIISSSPLDNTLGGYIFIQGRCNVAHGKGEGGGPVITGNEQPDYLKINDINIFMEIIARYIVEKMNPTLKQIIRRRY